MEISAADEKAKAQPIDSEPKERSPQPAIKTIAP